MPRIVPADAIFDEQRVPAFELPDVLRCEDGTRVRTAEEFSRRRRPELLELFRRHVYGRAPERVASRSVEVTRRRGALGGVAVHVELDVTLGPGREGRELSFQLSLWVPSGASKAPLLLGLNYLGNQSVHPEPQIRLCRSWVPSEPALGIPEHRATEASRGAHREQWPLELAARRGYAVATLCASELAADFDEGSAHGVAATFGRAEGSDACGAISAWAFGLSSALDALERVEELDPTKVGLVGHSRLGKAALWAAAQDPRFRFVVSNCSGAGGAALFRRKFGERLHHLTERFPHWFAPAFRSYEHREAELPIDQHQLLASIAPRPLFVASAEDDLWADPLGEYTSLCHASPAYALFGIEAPAVGSKFPPVGQSAGQRVVYHRRSGGHGLSTPDFERYLDFADRVLVR